jgi:caffeoyl-CoA O-methyltransferase
MKYLPLNDRLYNYLCKARTNANDPVLAGLRRVTSDLGDEARMQISEEQGAFLTSLVAAMSAKTAIEIGTFTGYSSICIARGLPEEGTLLCLDQREEWTTIASSFWKRAGVENKITLRLGDAIQALESLPVKEQFDFAFIDAAKFEYDTYFELVLPLLRANGIILFDNMLWDGRVIDESQNDEDTVAIRDLNEKLASDARVESVLLPIADGLQLCRKK